MFVNVRFNARAGLVLLLRLTCPALFSSYKLLYFTLLCVVNGPFLSTHSTGRLKLGVGKSCLAPLPLLSFFVAVEAPLTFVPAALFQRSGSWRSGSVDFVSFGWQRRAASFRCFLSRWLARCLQARCFEVACCPLRPRHR
jgi:hypothetical protein